MDEKTKWYRVTLQMTTSWQQFENVLASSEEEAAEKAKRFAVNREPALKDEHGWAKAEVTGVESV